MRHVSDPASGSVTPKACRRSSPAAMAGRYLAFWASEPWRRSVPITYIWAWQADGLPPDAEISSSTMAATVSGAPPPPYSSGIRVPSQPCWARVLTNSSG